LLTNFDAPNLKVMNMPFEFTSIYLDLPLHSERVLDLFAPQAITKDVAIFMTHGGGWSGGSRVRYHSLMEAFNAKGYLCATTDYRLAKPGTTILEQITDIRQAYDEFVSYLKRNNRPLKIVTFGSSAGAHLTELLSYAKPGQCGEALEYKGRRLANQWIVPMGVICSCGPVTVIPWDDIFPVIDRDLDLAIGATYEQDPQLYQRLSPQTYLGPDLPPTFFVCAEDEHIFPTRLTDAFVKQLTEIGVQAQYKVYPRVEHGFFYSLERWQQKEVFKDMLSFIESLLE